MNTMDQRGKIQEESLYCEHKDEADVAAAHRQAATSLSALQATARDR